MQFEKQMDLRVQKTRKAIKTAFKEMICEMDSNEITVKELSERAVIHRKTFYLHYTSIEALYEDMIQELANNYFEEIDKIAPDAPFNEVNRVFFIYMSEQEPYMEKVISTSGYREFADKLFLSMLRHNRTRYNPYSTYTEEQQNIINTFLSIGSINLYRQWLVDKKKLPLEELIVLSGKLFTNGISSII